MDAIIGFRADFELNAQWDMLFRGNVGGGGTDYSAGLQVDLRRSFSNGNTLDVGFRAVDIDYQDNAGLALVGLDLSMAGLTIGYTFDRRGRDAYDRIGPVPELDGTSRARIICASEPLSGARPIEPTLEDGYLLLVGETEVALIGAVRDDAPQSLGVDVSSGVEHAPGEKDPDRIRTFIKAARAAEQNR
mgnify:CR=1 FL=1